MNITADATRGPAGGATTAALEATGAVGSSPATVRTEGGGGGSLLPEPGAGGLDGIQDAMSMMYELVARQGEMSLESGETAVDAGARAEQVTGERQDAAIKQEEADEAKMNSHGFLADLESLAPKIAEYLGIAAAAVGAAALTVASCGTGGIAVAAVVVAVSATGMVASDTHCFGKDSAYIGLGLELTGAVFSLGASSGMVASGALQTVSAVADGASGAADVVAGASAIVVGNEQADVTDDTATVEQTTAAMNRNARLVADLVAGLKETQQSNRAALQLVAGASQTYAQTLTLASAGKA